MQYWQFIGSGTFVTQWGYNSADLVSSMVYPGGNAGQAGETVSYAYLPQMALETVSGSVNYVLDTLYDAAGRVELRKLGGTAASPTLQTDFTYFSWNTANGWGRLKRTTSGTPADTDSLQDLHYYSSTDTSQYDANGNLLNIYDYLASSPQTQTFTYDSLDRLISARASGGTEGKYGTESYSYDSATGNLSAKAGLAYSYDANHPHAVTQVDGVQQYWYDANGNQNKRTIGNPGQNLAPNPGFETSSNWTGAAVSQFQGTSFYRSTWGTADSHSETYAYAVSNHAYGYLQSDSIDISGSTQYNLYAYVRGEIDADDSSGEWIIRAYYYDSGGGAISYQDVAKGAAGSLTTIWQQKGGVITTPANADSLRIQLFNYMNTGWVAYDEVSLKLGTGQNMVTNPGFESIGNWSENPSSIYPGTSFYRSNWGPAAPYTGSYAYVISNHAYGYLLSDTIQVSAGVQYDLYAYVRGEIDPEGSAGYWLIRAYYYKSDGSSNGSLDVASGDPTTINTTWQQKGGRITTPANTATLRVALFNYHNTGWVAFDDVSLVQFCFGCYTNLVTNGDFEGTTGWSEITASQYPATSFYRSTWGIAAPHGGSYAYTISNLGYGSLDSDKINVSANTTYDAYAWVRGELDAEDGLGNWILLLRHYDSANNLVRSDYLDQGGPDTISTTWQQKGGRFTTPSNGAKVSIQLWIQLGSGWVTYDDVSLRPVVTYNLTYDAENRLTGVSGATTASFVYDGDGKRVKATAGGVTTAYVGNYFEWTGSTSTMVKYYYAGTTRVAMRVGSNNPKWLLSDHLGSQSIVASYNGLTEEGELRYKAWGESRYTSGTTPTKRQYTGQLSEMATIGLYFYGARFYDPALSRFTSADSIIPEAGDVQAWDRYAAMANNPVKYIDPTGHIYEGAMYAGEADAISMNKMIELYEIKFSGSWSISQKASAMLGVDKVGMALAKHTNTSAVGTFNAVFGSLTFTRNSNTENYCQGGGYGVTCGGAAPNDPRLYAHELGHTFNAVIVKNGNSSSPYSDLRNAAITDDAGNWVTGSHNVVFDRTFRGYRGEKAPFVYHGKEWDDWNSPNEDFADMFMYWAFNSFDFSSKARGAGAARYTWMETNMSNWISQASY